MGGLEDESHHASPRMDHEYSRLQPADADREYAALNPTADPNYELASNAQEKAISEPEYAMATHPATGVQDESQYAIASNTGAISESQYALASNVGVGAHDPNAQYALASDVGGHDPLAPRVEPDYAIASL